MEWVKAKEQLPPDDWKGWMRNKTLSGEWHEENNVPAAMVKGLLNHEFNLQIEWMPLSSPPKQ